MSKRFFCKVKDSYTGAVLPLFVILVFIMALMLAFIIDVGFLGVTNEQAQQYARFATLAAIEEYYDKLKCKGGGVDHPCSPHERYLVALKRVNEVFSQNFLVGAFGVNSTVDSPATSTTDVAILEPGTWYPKARTGETMSTPPCGTAPCFEPLSYPLETSYSESNIHPNAFRISGRFFNTTISRIGQNFLGTKISDFNVQAVSSLVPRRGCFLVDISTSMIRETHSLWDYNILRYSQWYLGLNPAYGPWTDSAIGWGNEFAFDLADCDVTNPGSINFITQDHCAQ